MSGFQTDNNLSEGAVIQVFVGGQSFFKAVDRVNDRVKLPLLKAAEHLLKDGSRTDGDALV